MDLPVSAKQATDAIGGSWKSLSRHECYLGIQYKLNISVEYKNLFIDGDFKFVEDIDAEASDKDLFENFRAATKDHVSPHNAVVMMRCLTENLVDWYRFSRGEYPKKVIEESLKAMNDRLVEVFNEPANAVTAE